MQWLMVDVVVGVYGKNYPLPYFLDGEVLRCSVSGTFSLPQRPARLHGSNPPGSTIMGERSRGTLSIG